MPSKKEEDKSAEKRLKVCESMLKACRDDDLKKVDEALTKGADINWKNDKGQTAAHVAAAFGALNVLRYLYEKDANFQIRNEKKLTPLEAAVFIGEEKAASLIKALVAGSSPAEIDAIIRDDGNDNDDDGEALTPRARKALKAMALPKAMTTDPPKPAASPVTAATVETVPKPDIAPDPLALHWANVHGHGRHSAGVDCKKTGTMTATSLSGVGSWVVGLGPEDRLGPGGAISFRIVNSRFNLGDAMLFGVVDSEVADAREARLARSVVYNPRAGEVWVMENTRVVERVALGPSASLLGNAIGTDVQVRIPIDGGIALRIGSAPEVVVALKSTVPAAVRACAWLGKVGDVIGLRKAAGSRAERASNDSVITDLS